MLSRAEPGEAKKGGGAAPPQEMSMFGTVVVVPLFFLPWLLSAPFGSIFLYSYTNCYLPQGRFGKLLYSRCLLKN